MKLTEPIRDKQYVKRILSYYKDLGQARNHLLLAMSVYTALRVGDLLRLKWGDVYDFSGRRVRRSLSLSETKTGKCKILALNNEVVSILSDFILECESGSDVINSNLRIRNCYPTKRPCRVPVHPGRYLFENIRTGKAISRVQVFRIIRAAAEAVGYGQNISSHSLRKTFGYHTWKSGVSPAVIMDIYNHSSFTVTRRYVGVTQDDRNEAYMSLNFTV